MSHKIMSDHEVSLNGQIYTLSAPVRKRYVDRFPAKINTGVDSYDKENILSNWGTEKQLGLIGKEEMDESVDYERCWWTNLNCDYPKHMLLPRLATEISAEDILTPTVTNADMETDATGWTSSGAPTTTGRSNTVAHAGTYSWRVSNEDASYTDYVYQDLTSTSFTKGASYTVTVWAKVGSAGGEIARISIDDGVSATNGTTNNTTDWVQLTVTKTISLFATQFRILLETGNGADGRYTYFDDVAVTCNTSAPSMTPRIFAEFNSSKYLASGTNLYKLNSGRTAYTIVGIGFGAAITALIPSLNSCLYIYCGDTEHYSYMSTSELFTHTDVTGAYYGFQWDDKLFKVSAAGVCLYATTPNSATPSWTATGNITDIASQIESFGVGIDSDGSSVPYCATNSYLKVLSVPSTGIGDAKWIDTNVKLPSHPNGGKGFCFWHDGHFISYGLGVKKYITGSTSSLSEVGLDQDDGLPYEYNGEIVKLYGDAGLNVMFALIDASQVTGTGYSGLYAYTGRGWRCWWIDATADEAMYDVIVSSASSSYAVYWAVGSSVWYIDIPRGNQNPIKSQTITSQTSYTTGDDSFSAISLTINQLAQTFTPSSDHTITKVKLKLYRVGTTGTVTVGIYATSSSKPTGSALCTGTLDGDIFTTDTNGDWYTFDLGAGTALTASTMYAIVLSFTNTIFGKTIGWRRDSTSPTYAGGTMAYSSDTGTTWTLTSGSDFMFEEYSVTSYFYYASSGTYYSSIFDANNSAWRKLIKRLRTYAKNLTSTETITIYYRTNRSFTDLSSGWTTLVTLDSTGENGEVLTSFASGLGINVAAIQFKIAHARGATTTVSPDLQDMVMSYRLSTTGYWVWSLPVILDGKHGRLLKNQQEDIEDAVASETDIPMILRRDDSDEPHYVKLNLPQAWGKTGVDFNGVYMLEAVET